MQYKTVPVFKTFHVRNEKDIASAIQSFEQILNSEAGGGWRFHSVQSVTTYRGPGCLGGLLGVKAERIDHQLLVYEKD